MKAFLNTDGGSRGNPGIAGFGFDLVDENGAPIASGGWFLPKATNNVAEYSALVWGLENALAAGVADITVRADSELMVKQMLGQYKVKSEDLKPLFMRAKDLFSRFAKASIAHVYRTENKRADALANETMDARGPVGGYLVAWEESPTNLFDVGAAAPLRSEKTEAMSFAEWNARTSNGEGPDRTASAGSRDQAEPCAERRQAALHENEPMKGTSMEHNPAYSGPGRLTGETYEHAGGHYELTVKDHFDAAHALPGYDGPCRFLHGHTWDIEVTIAGQHLDDVGMLYDFKDIKRDLHAVLELRPSLHQRGRPVRHQSIRLPSTWRALSSTSFEKTLPAPISPKRLCRVGSPAARVAANPFLKGLGSCVSEPEVSGWRRKRSNSM